MPNAATATTQPLALALRALELANAEPGRALRLSATVDAADPEAWSVAEHARGLAAKELHDLVAARAHLREAIRVATRAGLSQRAAEARISLSFVLLSSGGTASALREVERAGELLRGPDAARLQMRRALILQRLGRLDEALDGYRGALRIFRRAGDELWEAKLLCNRGVLHGYRGEFAAAERDLLRSEQLHTAQGQHLAAAQVRHNLGFVAARRGDVPAALAWYDAAEDDHRALGLTDWVGMSDRCELLLSVRLLRDARELAEHAVAQLARGGLAPDLAEAQLLLSQVALLQDDGATARHHAEDARRAFMRQRRPGWAALARYVRLRADVRETPAALGLLSLAQRVARELAGVGWALPAMDARLLSGQLALELDKVGTARRNLEVARTARFKGPVELRARAWHAEALLRLADGDRRGADGALRAGMRVLERHRTTLGATELRAHVGGHAGELATLGLRLALEANSPDRVFAWAERWRAGALQQRPVRPPDDEAMAADLAELRDVVAQINAAALAAADTRRLVARQATLERAIQRRTRRTAGPGHAPPTGGAVSAAELAPLLGDQALVEFFQLDGELFAVVVTEHQRRVERLGRHQEATTELEHLLAAMRRIAHGRAGPSSLAAACDAVEYAAARLDKQLLSPLRELLAERSLVVVPTGALHALPWALLPSCANRPVTVAPSAGLWCQSRASARSRAVALIACPEPPHALSEVVALQQHYPNAAVVTGTAATTAAVMDAIDGSQLAHLACHGRFRSDNPLFSSLELADGPLTVYDIERLSHPPQTLVLSACESGLSGVARGDELMGLAAALIAMGTSSIVASVVPVPDRETKTLMLRLHHHAARGSSAPDALAAAQRELAAEGAVPLVHSAGFVAFGGRATGGALATE